MKVKSIVLTTAVLFMCLLPVQEVFSQSAIKRGDMRVRDPFVFVDKDNGIYYMQASTGKGFKVYSSRDLETWTDLGVSFTPGRDFWGKTDFWAPDMYKYDGKYYIFGTFSDGNKHRGTSLLVSDSPEGPYTPLVNEAATPKDWMCLDGSLYVDEKGRPWMLYCHEWVEIEDGSIVAQRMSKDLRRMKGKPHTLFHASEAPWTGALPGTQKSYVTDAAFIIKTGDKRLTMAWSSFDKNKGEYAIGQSISESGNILGPWTHVEEPLNNDDGGHAMIFTDLGGNLKISYHAPNSVKEIPQIYPVHITGDGRVAVQK